MIILQWTIWGIAALFFAYFVYYTRQDARAGRLIHIANLLQIILFFAALILFALLPWNKLHLLWAIPGSMVLGLILGFLAVPIPIVGNALGVISLAFASVLLAGTKWELGGYPWETLMARALRREISGDLDTEPVTVTGGRLRAIVFVGVVAILFGAVRTLVLIVALTSPSVMVVTLERNLALIAPFYLVFGVGILCLKEWARSWLVTVSTWGILMNLYVAIMSLVVEKRFYSDTAIALALVVFYFAVGEFLLRPATKVAFMKAGVDSQASE